MAAITILEIRERDDGAIRLSYQIECGDGTSEVMNRQTSFKGGGDYTPWDDLRIWLAMNSEAADRSTHIPDIPADIADLVGKPVDTSELRQRFKPQLDAHKARAAEARAQRESE